MDQDSLLEYSFFAAIKRVKDKDLPILLSTFYSGNILPNRPATTTVDIKKTKYKKVSISVTILHPSSDFLLMIFHPLYSFRFFNICFFSVYPTTVVRFSERDAEERINSYRGG